MNTRRWMTTILACLSVVAMLAIFKYFQIQAAIAYGKSFPEQSATVEAELTQLFDSKRSINTVGEIISPQMIELKAELEGTIVSVNFGSGALVKKGDVLIQLDISEEQAQLSAAKARAKLARLDSLRVKRLLKDRSVSQERVDQAEAEYAIAQAEIARIQSVIDKKTIKAPFDAKSGLHLFEVGQYLQRNATVTHLVGLQEYYWIDFTLPVTSEMPKLGDSIEVSLPTLSEKTLSANIIAVDSMVSENSRSLRFRGRLNINLSIASNTFANVRVILGTQKLIKLPLMAIQTDSLGTFVYRLESDSEEGQYRAKRRQIDIGKELDDKVLILNGLEIGELIATTGSFKLRENLLVFIADASGEANNPVSETETETDTLTKEAL